MTGGGGQNGRKSEKLFRRRAAKNDDDDEWLLNASPRRSGSDDDSGRHHTATGLTTVCIWSSSSVSPCAAKKKCQPGGISTATQALHNLSLYCLFISGQPWTWTRFPGLTDENRPPGVVVVVDGFERCGVSYLSPSTKRVIWRAGTLALESCPTVARIRPIKGANPGRGCCTTTLMSELIQLMFCVI